MNQMKSTLEIPNDVIEPIIQARVTAAVMEALGGYERIIETAVGRVLNQKVDDKGQPSNYTSSSSPSWLKWVMDDCVKKSAKAAVEKFFADNQSKIEEALIKELSKKNSPLLKQMVAAFMGGVVNTDRLKYRLEVSVIEPRY